ncbi:MAG: hypothetical protein ACP5IJ_02455 [Candidatus Nanoarchaeia archaeon]
MVIKVETMLREIGITLEPEMLQILDLLQKKKKVSEEEIAKKMNMRVNDVRKLIYRLYEKGLAVYEKKPAPRKKWWYLYYWFLNKDKVAELFLEYKKKQLEKKKKELSKEENFSFVCMKCQTKYTQTEALDIEFTCPTCNEILVELGESPEIKKLRQDIARLEKEISNLEKKLAQKEPKKEPKKRV